MADLVSVLRDVFARTLAPQRASAQPVLLLAWAQRVLHHLFAQSRGLQEVIQQAEAELKALSAQPGYSINLLQVGICQQVYPKQGKGRQAKSLAR